jgi:membrane glycosyltransferase
MVFHARFVALNLMGKTVSWRSSKRDDNETGWVEALRHHGIDTLIACAWGGALLWLNPRYFFWIAPVIVALVLSIPISVLVSRLRLGDRARRLGLFTIPEETDPAVELRELEADLAEQHRIERGASDGVSRCAADPLVNALHRGLLGSPRKLRPDIRAFREGVLERVLASGAEQASAFDKRVLMSDPDMVDELHRRAWTLAGDRVKRG